MKFKIGYFDIKKNPKVVCVFPFYTELDFPFYDLMFAEAGHTVVKT